MNKIDPLFTTVSIMIYSDILVWIFQSIHRNTDWKRENQLLLHSFQNNRPIAHNRVSKICVLLIHKHFKILKLKVGSIILQLIIRTFRLRIKIHSNSICMTSEFNFNEIQFAFSCSYTVCGDSYRKCIFMHIHAVFWREQRPECI